MGQLCNVIPPPEDDTTTITNIQSATNVIHNHNCCRLQCDGTVVTNGGIANNIPSDLCPKKDVTGIILGLENNINQPCYITISTTGVVTARLFRSDGSVGNFSGYMAGSITWLRNN